jgi:2,3-bisphosphoglycerate-dependent phosphoglycerate mutase
MRNIYIVRHTEALHHVQKLGGGWYDTSLTEKGRAQARKIAGNLFNKIKLPGIPIYTSDLKRCVEMADIFTEVFKSKIINDKNLREMNFGEGGGKPREWYDNNTLPLPHGGNPLDHRIFNGAESKREAGTRAQIFMEKLIKTPDENMIVLTHGFFTNFLIMAWIKMPVESMGYADFRGSSGGVALLNEDDFWHNRNVIYTNRKDFLEE